jgi:hypothetical protein
MNGNGLKELVLRSIGLKPGQLPGPSGGQYSMDFFGKSHYAIDKFPQSSVQYGNTIRAILGAFLPKEEVAKRSWTEWIRRAATGELPLPGNLSSTMKQALSLLEGDPKFVKELQTMRVQGNPLTKHLDPGYVALNKEPIALTTGEIIPSAKSLSAEAKPFLAGPMNKVKPNTNALLNNPEGFVSFLGPKVRELIKSYATPEVYNTLTNPKIPLATETPFGQGLLKTGFEMIPGMANLMFIIPEIYKMIKDKEYDPIKRAWREQQLKQNPSYKYINPEIIEI